jgi:hypothetical protein
MQLISREEPVSMAVFSINFSFSWFHRIQTHMESICGGAVEISGGEEYNQKNGAQGLRGVKIICSEAEI